MQQFVHLHVHTQYSLLDGAIRIPRLMDRVKELGMPAVAMTDHGNMYGAIDFQKAAHKKGVKSIIGCEMYMTNQKYDESTDAKSYHLTLLAQNLQGYKNLMYLNSMAWLHGQHETTQIPRIDFELLAQRNEGIICLSGDLGGEINQFILQDNLDAAARLAQQYKEVFGPDRYYLEIMDNALPEQQRCTQAMIELSQKVGVPLVATNDCHYHSREDARSHAVLMCIQLGKTADVDHILDHGVDQLYLRTAQEMWQAFEDVPEACENTLKIAEMCHLEIPLGEVYLPQYRVPQEFTKQHQIADPKLAIHEYFESMAKVGLVERFQEMEELGQSYDKELYEARLQEEIDIIRQMDFPGYFLIVWDFIRWSHQNKIPVGPGRGSGAGSLVAFSMRITDIDPIPYDLIFERFLNPERVSMPDFDIDFCMNRRGEVIDYVANKYGYHNCGQIITYGQLKARACVRDVGRVLKLTTSEIDRIAKLIPDELDITLTDALAKEKRLTDLIDEDARVKTLFDIALDLEKLNRQAGMHAAGLVISETPLWDYVPICRGAHGELVSQYAKEEVEEAGLIKFDFLGLKTLTVIDDAVRLINQQYPDDKEAFAIKAISLDDQGVYDLISSGNTTGVFQLESSGFQELLKKLKPDCFEDIIAAVALYRPGPLGSGMVDDFIDRKHGRKSVEYPHPWLEEVLKPTYGVMVYQEQVMKTAQVIAGYTLGGADLLRRAMGKKKKEVMDAQKAIFLEGAKKQEVDLQQAENIFDLMAYFAGYGFNKSHSAAYALITYQTAYLKVHYPVEFMAALMTNDTDKTDKIVRFINEAKDMGIDVLPPDVNQSLLSFSVVDGKIRFGLAAIKGVGTSVIEMIIECREKDGPFTSIYNFCARVDFKKINRRAIEALVKCGAFDSIGPANQPVQSMFDACHVRSSIFAAIELAIERGTKAQHDKAVGQASLFGIMAQDDRDEFLEDTYPECDTWSDRYLLDTEKSLLGFYVTGHPLDRFVEELPLYGVTSVERINQGRNISHRDVVVVAGVITNLREIPLKSGKGRMAFISLEDKSGEIEIIAFSQTYEEFEEVIRSGELLLVRAQVQEEGDPENRTMRLRCEDVRMLADERQRMVKKLCIDLDVADAQNGQLHALQKMFIEHPGNCKTSIAFTVNNQYGTGRAEMILPDTYLIDPCDDLVHSIEQLFGRKVTRFV